MNRLSSLLLGCLAAGMLLFSSCNTQSAFEFNKKLLAIDDSLGVRMEKLTDKLNRIKDYKDFVVLADDRKNAEAYIDAQIKIVSEMKDVDGSEQLRKEMIGYLQCSKDVVSKGLAPLETIDENATQQDVDRMMKNIQVEQARLEVQTRRLQDAQQEFARKNNFRIED